MRDTIGFAFMLMPVSKLCCWPLQRSALSTCNAAGPCVHNRHVHSCLCARHGCFYTDTMLTWHIASPVVHMYIACLEGCRYISQMKVLPACWVTSQKMKRSDLMTWTQQTCHSWVRSSCRSGCKSSGRSPLDVLCSRPLCHMCCTAQMTTAHSPLTHQLALVFLENANCMQPGVDSK